MININHSVPFQWPQIQTNYPRNACIHELFEQQAIQTPETVAVVFEELTLTYAQLNRRANQLAHHLRLLGIGPESLVGICVERSVEMVVGLLGILKAGSAYVPLDPTYPPSRLTWMLADAQVQVLLTQATLAHFIEPLQATRSPLTTIYLDTNWPTLAKESEVNLVNQTTAENLAYVMYTSGSTGQPKGVSVIHRGVVRLVKNTNYANFTADEIFLQLAPISFDASTFEIWGALLNSAKLVIMPPQPPSLAELGNALRRYQVTTLWLTAGLFHQMVNERLEDLQELRQLLAGGEALSVPHVKKVLQMLKNGVLINGYGPTENTTFTCCYPMTEVSQVGETVPIGPPISNTQVYVLDEHRHPVPIGTPGELYIGGDGLAREYFRRPELTAEKFVYVPIFGEHTEPLRLYKTGDLVRCRPDGILEFIGRIDHQIKLRGFRIEPGEIETTLQQFPNVRQALVIAKEISPDDKRLIAYLVVTPMALEQADFTRQLRLFLADRLPHYMLPSAVIRLTAFPTTPNGKVDRDALPLPTWKGTETVGDLPRTPTEILLQKVFANLLGTTQIGIHDNFFDLGGHSLLATQLLVQVRDLFQVELPLPVIFEQPTIIELAELIETEKTKCSEMLPPLPVQPVPLTGHLLLSFPQQQLWFGVQFSPDVPMYNEPITLYLGSSINVPALAQSLQELLRRHAALRTRFQMEGGQPVQIISPPPVVVQESTAQLCQGADKATLWTPEVGKGTEAAVLQLATQEARRPFDLTQDLLIRAMLVQLGGTNGEEEDYRLYLTLHHIIFDGISFYTVLLQELETLYQAFSKGAPSPLLEPTWQYPDFAIWQRHWLSPSRLEPQLIYWKQQLANLPILELPTDHPRPATPTFQGAMHVFAWSKSLTDALKVLSRQEGVTLSMTLLAAFQTLLHRYSGQEDIMVGTVKANRNRPEWERMCGLFLNTLVLRTDFSGDPSFQELLTRVKKVTLDAYTHQDLPFEYLVEALQPNRVAGANPLFQVTFTFDPPVANLNSGWELHHFDVHTGTAKFDLTLELDERPTGIIGRFEYSTDLFEATTIVRMADHLETLLENVVANPQQRLSDFPLLPPSIKTLPVIDSDKTDLSPKSPPITRKDISAEPQNVVERQVAELWEKLLKVQPIGRHDNFFELGGHSLLAVTLLERINKTFGKSISLITLFQMPTIAQLAEVLRETTSPKTPRALVAIQLHGSRPAFFFIGSTNYARALAPHLGSMQSVYGLNLFGLQDYNNPTYLSVEGIAQRYLQEIQTVQPHGPYYLGGFCGDAVIAFEMAQQLRVGGEKVAFLGFIDLIWEPQQGYSRHWQNLLEFGPGYLFHKIQQKLRFTQEQLVLTMNKWKDKFYYHGKTALMPPKSQDMLFISAFYEALEKYQPRPYPGHVTLFLSREWREQNSYWLQKWTTGEVEIYEVVGYHDNLFLSPQIEELGRQLRECLIVANSTQQ